MHSTRPIIVVLLLIISLPLLGFTPSEEQLAAVEQLTALPVQTYKQPFNDEMPEESQRDKGLVYLTPDNIIQLNSPLIFEAITWQQYNDQYPLRIYLLDRKTLHAILHKNLVIGKPYHTVGLLKKAKEALHVDFVPSIPALQQFPPKSMCQLYKNFPPLQQAVQAALCNEFLFLPTPCKAYTLTERILQLTTSANGQHIILLQHSGIIHNWDNITGTFLPIQHDGLRLRWDDIMGTYLPIRVQLGIAHVREGRFQKPIVVTPDGQHIILESGEGTLYSWEITTGRVQAMSLQPFRGKINRIIIRWCRDNDEIKLLAVTPDGQHIIGSLANTIRVWDLATGALLNTFGEEENTNTTIGHTRAINFVIVSPNRQHVISGSCDRTIRIWDFSGTLLNTLEGHTESITCIAVTPDEQRIVSSSKDCTIRIWDASTGQLLKTLNNEIISHRDTLQRPVKSLAITPNGKFIVSLSAEMIRIWNLVTGKLVQTLNVDNINLRDLAITSNGQHIISCSDYGNLFIWEQESLHDFCTRMGVEI